LKLADYVVQFFADKGVPEIFVVYGAANGDLVDAFTRIENTNYVCPMHEQGGGFAAEGYAKITGKASVMLTTSGPGAQNLTTSIANFFYDSVPGIFLTGQVDSRYLKTAEDIRQRGFQETPIAEIVGPITKYAKMITDPSTIRMELEKAWHLANSGRPGPVLLDFPINIQKAEVELESQPGYQPEVSEIKDEEIDEVVSAFLRDLESAERPGILVGGGVRTAGAIDKLIELGHKLGVPMFPTWNALDIVTDDLPFFGGRIGTYGGRGRNFAIQNCDLILGLGTRVSGRLFGSNNESFLRAAKKYLVNIDKTSLRPEDQEVEFDVNIQADAADILDRLLSHPVSNRDFSDWLEWTKARVDKYDPVLSEYDHAEGFCHPYKFIRILSEEMAKGDILVGDCGGNIVTIAHAFMSKMGQRMITNNGNSPMGFSFCGAMGAKLAANPASNVVCIIGDGGFTMNTQELQTIHNYNIGVKTFIMNNHCYGITRQFQRTRFEGREEACGPKGYSPPDFVRVAEAYDVPTLEIHNNGEARGKIREVLEHDGPIVCVIDCGDWDQYEPRVFGSRPIEDMWPLLPRDEFQKNMIIPPVGQKDQDVVTE